MSSYTRTLQKRIRKAKGQSLIPVLCEWAKNVIVGHRYAHEAGQLAIDFDSGRRIFHPYQSPGTRSLAIVTLLHEERQNEPSAS